MSQQPRHPERHRRSPGFSGKRNAFCGALDCGDSYILSYSLVPFYEIRLPISLALLFLESGSDVQEMKARTLSLKIPYLSLFGEVWQGGNIPSTTSING